MADLKANDLRVLDVRKLTDVTDYMIIASGRSGRHVRAIAENVVEQSKKKKHQPLGVEGLSQGEWVLVDLCDVVVHVMVPETREFYQLEKLWGRETPAVTAATNAPR
jgi:ribosome-associated protein